jgi:endonuclease YncB( thermonuclease family)
VARKRDNVVGFRKPFRAVPLRRVKRRPPRPPKRGLSWQQAWHETRPIILTIALVTISIITATPGAYEPPAFLQSARETISGTFTRCGKGRGYYCVVDGDTFRIGKRKIRVVGIDTAEVDARCPAEQVQAEQSTAALQAWLNRGAFGMTARIDNPYDRYGRELRIVKRIEADGREDRLADWMQTNGGARGYLGGWRGGWC